MYNRNVYIRYVLVMELTYLIIMLFMYYYWIRLLRYYIRAAFLFFSGQF